MTTSEASLLVERYRRVRAATERLAAPLSAEDQALQSMPACSPTKWHRAHTTWFFETFVLAPRGVPAFDARWGLLFNSYYEALGPRVARPLRGLLSRPSAAEIAAYRRAVDARMLDLLGACDQAALAALAPLVELGLAHEEQHQELVLTDIQHALSEHPLAPAYHQVAPVAPGSVTPLGFVDHPGGLLELGVAPGVAFHFDNEAPRHRVWLEPFALADRLVTVSEWKAFADAGGYRTPSLWLAEGFDWVRAHQIEAPLYTRREGDTLLRFDLGGLREAADHEPVIHVSYYEADALARFMGARLPSEAEWEALAVAQPVEGGFTDDGTLRPRPARPEAGRLAQLYGEAWQWTRSAYAPYPGYQAAAGAVGEYNGKFMVNQLVLRGGSCFTPRGHVRASYRNFWHPDTRFQVSAVRLARSHVD